MAITRTHPANHTPLAELNITPLIDVMLVLLVMMILSVPVATHSLELDLPRPGEADPTTPILTTNVISITPGGTITWNGTATSEPGLTRLLLDAAAQEHEPLNRFEPAAEAPYAVTLQVLNLAKAADPGLFALAGTERYAHFNRVR